MVARKPDLAQAVLDGGWVVDITLCDCRKSQDCVHGCADVVGHGRKEVALGAICRLGFLRRLVQAHVEPVHKCHVADKQEQQGTGDPDDQKPVNGTPVQAARPDVVQDGPALIRADGRVGYQTLLTTRIVHEEGTILRGQTRFQLLYPCCINLVIRFIELDEVAVLVFVTLDDVIAVTVYQRDFCVTVLVDGKHPFFLKLFCGNDAQENRLSPPGRVIGIHERDPIAERQ